MCRRIGSYAREGGGGRGERLQSDSAIRRKHMSKMYRAAGYMVHLRGVWTNHDRERDKKGGGANT